MNGVRTAMLAAFLVVVLALLPVTSAAARARSGAARLGSGSVSKFRWWVNAQRGRTPEVPCLQIELVPMGKRSPFEVGLGETSCRPIRPLPNAFGVVDELVHPNVTVIAMAFPEAAQTVSLYFRGRLETHTLPLRLLSEGKARKTGLRPFRYLAFAFKGDSCLSRFITHDSGGHVLYDGGRMHC